MACSLIGTLVRLVRKYILCSNHGPHDLVEYYRIEYKNSLRR